MFSTNDRKLSGDGFDFDVAFLGDVTVIVLSIVVNC